MGSEEEGDRVVARLELTSGVEIPLPFVVWEQERVSAILDTMQDMDADVEKFISGIESAMKKSKDDFMSKVAAEKAWCL